MSTSPPTWSDRTGPPPLPVPELDGAATAEHGPVRLPAPDTGRPAVPFEAGSPRPADPGPPIVLAPPGRGPAATVRLVVLVVGVVAVSWGIGRLTGDAGVSLVHNRMLPWILGRGLGVAAYVALTGTVVLGLWLRHPWRARFRWPTPAAVLWAHVALAACTLVLVAGHVCSLALDRYAGVGWSGAFVPGSSTFRTTGVALGTVALYGLVLVVGTAALAGSIGRAAWFPVHSASVLVFCCTLAHGVLSGSDGATLRWVYVASGLVVLILQGTRWAVGTLVRAPGSTLG